MPEKIMRCAGLYFTVEELKKAMMSVNLNLDNDADFQDAVEFVEHAFSRNAFEEFGFSNEFRDIDEITGDINGLEVYF